MDLNITYLFVISSIKIIMTVSLSQFILISKLKSHTAVGNKMEIGMRLKWHLRTMYKCASRARAHCSLLVVIKFINICVFFYRSIFCFCIYVCIAIHRKMINSKKNKTVTKYGRAPDDVFSRAFNKQNINKQPNK